MNPNVRKIYYQVLKDHNVPLLYSNRDTNTHIVKMANPVGTAYVFYFLEPK